MRTLSRPMFNMGGPIKEGVMHGIREPYRGGQLVRPGPGRQGYQGIGTGINAARWLATLAGKTFGNVGRSYNLGKIGGGAGRNYPLMNIPQKGWAARMGEKVSGAIPARLKSWVTGDPLYKTIAGGTTMAGRGVKWGGKKLYETGKYGLTTPSGLALTGGTAWMFWPDGTKKTKEELAAQGLDQHGPFDHTDKKKIKKAQADFAKKQRDTRVQKYLDLMGYDQSRYDAISKALVDASKIISEKGTLKGDVTRDLINPIIQATSARLEKPKQIREAVGLMMVKGEIEKEMYEAKPGTILKNVQDMIKSGIPKDEAWAIATKESKGVVADLQGAIATGKMSLADWPAFVRATGAQHGEEVTVITEEEIKANPEKYATFKDKDIMEIVKGSPPGIYIIGSETVRIDAGGKATQLR